MILSKMKAKFINSTNLTENLNQQQGLLNLEFTDNKGHQSQCNLMRAQFQFSADWNRFQTENSRTLIYISQICDFWRLP